MKSRHWKTSAKAWIGAVAALLAFAGWAPAQDDVADEPTSRANSQAQSAPTSSTAEKNAKDLYYESLNAQSAQQASSVQPSNTSSVGGTVPPPFTPRTAPPSIEPLPSHIGLRYKIVLKDLDGDIREVTEKFQFSTGDAIRLVFESNINGYLYLYHRGASSKGVQLFPNPQINGGDNRITKDKQISVPPEDAGWLKFDAAIGQETLYVFLSPKPIGNLAGGQFGQEMEAMAWNYVTAATRSLDANPHSRDLFFEAASPSSLGTSEPPQPSVGYVVTTSPMLLHHLVLKHGR